MKRLLPVYKPLGLSPLQTIHLLQEQYPEYQGEKIGYAGRLDPLAEGLLLLLVGDENKQKKQYENLPKTYEFQVLFGVSTDTYDTLGLITDHSDLIAHSSQLKAQINDSIPSFLGTFSQPYPPFSSRTVHGKPLYWYARNNKLSEITIPERTIEITSLELLSSTLLPSKKIEQEVMSRIQKVSGEFRQDGIKLSWQSFFDSSPLPHFPIFSFCISCSSGTYVRSLAHTFGERLGAPALAYAIKRTAIGSYSLENAINLTL